MVVSSHSVFNADGLNTTANPIGSVAKGSAVIADNCVVREKDIYESRRGQDLPSHAFGNVYDRANEVFFFNGTPLYQYGPSFLTRDTGSAFVDVSGNNTPPSSALRMKSAQANGKFFFTTEDGIKVLDSPDGVPVAAGIPKPFNVEAASIVDSALVPLTRTVDVVGFNWLPTANQIGIRVCFGERDARGSVQLGPVSELAIVTNSSGSDRSIVVHVGIPSGITTANFYRIHMTDPSGGADIDPGDECYLNYEGSISAANITAGYLEKQITIVESVTSDNPLHTNPNTGDGIESSKHPAPYAKDLCYWDKSLWAFGVKRKQTFHLTLLGTGNDGTGLGTGDDDLLTINGLTYSFNDDDDPAGESEEIPGTWTVPIDEGSSAEVRLSAQSIVYAINLRDPDVRAYYVPKADGWPGEIVIEESGHGADAFTVYGDVDSAPAFSPQLPLTAETALSSTADDFPHWAWHTPVDEPEAWPLGNFIPAGKRGSTVLRGVPLKDRMYCFMDDATIQVISGSGGQYRVDELDSTAQVYGPDTVRVANNQIFALTSQGLCTIGEGGVGVIGLPIEADVRSLFGPALETTKLVSFGFGYESERTYAVWLPTLPGQAVAQQGFLYNYFTKSWTRWPMARSCGGVNPLTDKLYMGDGDTNQARVERKSLTNEDFADETLSVAISAASGKTLTVASTTGISVGDMVQQGDSVRAIVTEVTDATHLEVHSSETWALTTLTVYVAIPCELQWSPATMGAPGVVKKVTELSLHFGEAAFVHAEATMTTDDSAEPARVKTMQRIGWGEESWGEFPWGEPSGPTNERGGIPLDKAMGAYFHPRFYIREAKSSWKLLGYTMEHDPISSRTSK
jgi:hypothetical protein